jgi:hypothetical protein
MDNQTQDHSGASTQLQTQVMAEMRRMEERMMARIDAHTQAMAERERFSLDGLHSLRAELSFAIAQLTVLREQSVAAPARAETVSDRGMSRVEDAVLSIGDRLSSLEGAVKASTARIEGMEQNLDSMDQATAEVRDSVTRDMVNFERAFRSQAAAIESTRTAIAQTDDLVERIVEAVESLQGAVMERSNEEAKRKVS